MQRAEVGSRFKGIEVVWKVSFYSASSKEGGLVQVFTHTEGLHAREHIIFDVNLAIYPFLKVLEDGATLWVRGQIGEVQPMYVELSEAQISLTDPVALTNRGPLLSEPPKERGSHPADQWYKRPIGMVGIGVLITVLGTIVLKILSDLQLISR